MRTANETYHNLPIVEAMRSQRSGNPIANQFIISHSEGNIYTEYFQSYDVLVAKVSGGNVEIDVHYWDYSVTTLKYLKQFLGTTLSKKEIAAKIESGEWRAVELNGRG